MFDWFRRPDYSNVVKFPEQPKVPNNPYIEPPKREKNPAVYYAIGHTDNNRVSLTVGHTSVFMTYDGVQMLIDQLELYQSQLSKDDSE